MENTTPSSPADARVQQVELTVPAQPEYVAVVRLAAAGVAGRMAFSYDDIEDLKIAVAEACTVAVRAGGRQVHIRFDIGTDRLDIRIAHDTGRLSKADEESELGMFLMRCLMDEVRTEGDGPQVIVWLTKRLHG